MRHLAVIVSTVVIVAGSPAARAGSWILDADLRVGPTVELSGSAPSDRTGVVPVTALKIARLVGPVAMHGILRAGPPPAALPHGAVALGVGLGGERTLSRRPASRTVAFALVEGGVSLTYIDAPPEAHLYPDAVLYWGPVGRVETGLRFLVARPRGRELGWGLSVAGDVTSARYTEPDDGRGTRLGLEVALSGEVRF